MKNGCQRPMAETSNRVFVIYTSTLLVKRSGVKCEYNEWRTEYRNICHPVRDSKPGTPGH